MVSLAAAAPIAVQGYEAAFPRTPVNRTEVKELPACEVMEATCSGEYFRNANRLFRSLFSYIRKHKVPMTVPVQAGTEPGTMVFFVGKRHRDRGLPSEDGVRISRWESRTVASLGGRGGYSEKNYRRTRRALEAWVVQTATHRPLGKAYAVYWSGPYVPSFLKRYEVHIPVEPIATTSTPPR